MASHAGLALARGAGSGVDIFFVLSGFLITSLLLEEFQSQQRIDLRSFYVRRAARLVPGLWLCVATLALVSLVLPVGLTPLGAITALLYVSNIPPALGHTLGALNPTWSLSLEWQFYLLIPLSLPWVMRRARPAMLVGTGAVSSYLLANVLNALGVPGHFQFYLPYSHAYSLLAGVALAVWLRGERPVGVLPRLAIHAKRGSVAATALVLIVAQGVLTHSGRIAMGLWYPLVVVCTVVLIVHCTSGGALGRFFAARPVVWVGTISYSLYLWHMGVYLALGVGAHRGRLLLALPIIFVLAWVSTRWVERPVRRYVGARLGRQPLELLEAK